MTEIRIDSELLSRLLSYANEVRFLERDSKVDSYISQLHFDIELADALLNPVVNPYIPKHDHMNEDGSEQLPNECDFWPQPMELNDCWHEYEVTEDVLLICEDENCIFARHYGVKHTYDGDEMLPEHYHLPMKNESKLVLGVVDAMQIALDARSDARYDYKTDPAYYDALELEKVWRALSSDVVSHTSASLYDYRTDPSYYDALESYQRLTEPIAPDFTSKFTQIFGKTQVSEVWGGYLEGR